MVGPYEYLKALFHASQVYDRHELSFSQGTCLTYAGTAREICHARRGKPHSRDDRSKLSIAKIRRVFRSSRKPNLSEGFTALNEQGLVTVEVPEEDKRLKYFELTPKGKEINDSVVKRIGRINYHFPQTFRVSVFEYLKALDVVQYRARKERIGFTGANLILFLGARRAFYLNSPSPVPIYRIVQNVRAYAQSTISESLEKLAQREYVTLNDDPKDGRRTLVDLAPEGRRVYSDITTTLKEII